MQFSSFAFALFFLSIFAIYHIFRNKYRIQNAMLLGASYLFYAAWDHRFLFLLIVPTALDYMFALMMHRNKLLLSQRLKPAAALLISFFAFVFVQYGSITLKVQDDNIRMSVDWNTIISPYGWELLGIIVLGLVVLNLLFSLSVKWDETRRRKLFVILSILTNLSLLGFFKYFNFFSESLAAVCKTIFGITIGSHILNIALPVGISFFIFKTLSYTIDVYRKKSESTESFLDFASYLAFFPQLLAGPIERPQNFIPQFAKARPDLSMQDIKEGVWLFLWGLFKKAVVADNLAIIVNTIFAPYDQLTIPIVVPEDGIRMLLGIYAFTIQIYSDFSGYTDMSRGLARLLGFNTMLNFNLPYFSITPGVFWRRWHISLSSWLRDYLYIPLGGNKCSQFKMYLNIMITMMIGGLWHGASWTFVLWGTYHGILLVIYRFLGIENSQNDYPVWKKVAHGFITFNLIAFGWLLFRARNLTTVGVFLKSIFTSPFGSPEALTYGLMLMKYSWFLLLFQIIQARVKNLEPLYTWNWFAKLNVWIYLLFALWVFSTIQTKEFIYFAF